MLPCSDYPTEYTAGMTDSSPRVFSVGELFAANPTKDTYNSDVDDNIENDLNITVNDSAASAGALPNLPSVRRMEQMIDAHAARQPAAALE